jgi:hypothetical protein
VTPAAVLREEGFVSDIHLIASDALPITWNVFGGQ